MNDQKMLLIVGSPRKAGTSYSFSRTIKILVEEFGHSADIHFAIDYLDGRRSLDELRSTIGQCDILAVVSAVYVDSSPYPLVWLMERLAAESGAELRGKRLFGVAQCAFPDVALCEPLLESCHCFADEASMQWLGGLAYAGGVLLNGAHIEDLGGRGRKIISAFRLALTAVLSGGAIPNQAQHLFALRIPRVLFYPLSVVMNHRNRRAARLQGTDIERKVYLE